MWRIIVVLGCFILVSSAKGQGITYSRTVAAGSFRIPTLWTPFSSVPPVMFGPGGSTDNARFDLGQNFGNLYTITAVFGINNRLVIENDSLNLQISDYETVSSLTGSNSSVVVGRDAGDMAIAIFSAAAPNSEFRSVNSVIGSVTGALGSVFVSGDDFTWDNSGTVRVGNAGTGNLFVLLGGRMESNSIVVADATQGVGSVTVNGTGSILQVDSNLVVASSGEGLLSIEDGGQVMSDSVTIAQFIGQTTSNGEVIVEGTNSCWLVMDDLCVGAEGHGSLAVMDGGEVSSDLIRLGDFDLARGCLLVDGLSSSVGTDLLEVGFSGFGFACASNGSSLCTIATEIGRSDSSTGELVIETGANWDTSDLIVGRSGDGSLIVRTAGFAVCDGNAYVGQLPFSNGDVLVRDESTLLVIDQDLVIGGNFDPTAQTGGDGLVTVQFGGTIGVNDEIFLFPEATLNLAFQGTLSADSINFVAGGGDFNFTGGTLHVDSFNGDLNNEGGTLDPGNVPFGSSPIGGSTVFGNYTQNSSSSLRFEIQGLEAGTGYDVLTVTGDAFLDGGLRVNLLDGFVPSADDSFNVMSVTIGDIFGFFDIVGDNGRLHTEPDIGSFLVRYGITSPNPNQIILSDFQPNFILGDVNGDGEVNLLDVAPFVAVVSGGIYNPAADIDMDGDVDLLDVAPFVALLTG